MEIRPALRGSAIGRPGKAERKAWAARGLPGCRDATGKQNAPGKRAGVAHSSQAVKPYRIGSFKPCSFAHCTAMS